MIGKPNFDRYIYYHPVGPDHWHLGNKIWSSTGEKTYFTSKQAFKAEWNMHQGHNSNCHNVLLKCTNLALNKLQGKTENTAAKKTTMAAG